MSDSFRSRVTASASKPLGTPRSSNSAVWVVKSKTQLMWGLGGDPSDRWFGQTFSLLFRQKSGLRAVSAAQPWLLPSRTAPAVLPSLEVPSSFPGAVEARLGGGAEFPQTHFPRTPSSSPVQLAGSSESQVTRSVRALRCEPGSEPVPGRALVAEAAGSFWPGLPQTQNLGCTGVLEPGGQSMDHISPLITLEQVR